MIIDLRKLNSAEKRLLAGLGVSLVLLVHLFGLRFLWSESRQLNEEVELRRAEKGMVEALLAESSLWQPRQDWLLRHLPPKTTGTRKVLDEKVEAVGKQFSLISQRGKTEEEEGSLYDAEHYKTSLSGPWPNLIQALRELYLPQEGIALTLLKVTAVDEKTHNAEIVVSRFFLREPAGGPR